MLSLHSLCVLSPVVWAPTLLPCMPLCPEFGVATSFLSLCEYARGLQPGRCQTTNSPYHSRFCGRHGFSAPSVHPQITHRFLLYLPSTPAFSSLLHLLCKILSSHSPVPPFLDCGRGPPGFVSTSPSSTASFPFRMCFHKRKRNNATTPSPALCWVLPPLFKLKHKNCC